MHRLLQNVKLSSKLFICYTIPLLVIMSIYIVSSSISQQNSTYKLLMSHHDDTSRQVLMSVETEISQMDMMLKMIYTDTESLNAILTGPSVEGYFSGRLKLGQAINNFLFLTPRDENFVLLDLSGQAIILCHNDAAYISLENCSEDAWFQDTLVCPVNKYVISVQPLSIVSIDYTCVAISRPVRDLNTKKVIAVAVIYENMQDLSVHFADAILDDSEVVCVRDAAGDVLYCNRGVPQHIESLGEKNGLNLVQIDGDTYLKSSVASDMLGWEIEVYSPYSGWPNISDIFSGPNISAILVLIGISLILAYLLSYSVTKPLSTLAKMFARFEHGDFTRQVEDYGRDEIGAISHAYNEMGRKTQILIHEKYELTILKTQARLDALQSQINPHFLFNTLNSIKTVCTQQQDDTSSRMIQSLADLLRYSLNFGASLVPFRQELDLVKKYIYLQECRFQNKFSTEFDIAVSTLGLYIPYLTIQPLVENVFKHGLEQQSEACRIIITTKQMGSRFLIYISNTGSQIPEEKLTALNQQFCGPAQISSERIGLANVWYRLQLHFDSQCRMRISSTTRFTTVYIEIPAVSQPGDLPQNRQGELGHEDTSH